MKALQTRFDAEGARLTCIAPHRGFISTSSSQGLLGSVPFLGWLLKNVVMPVVYSDWHQGAMVIASAAASFLPIEAPAPDTVAAAGPPNLMPS